jgi:hypothetical protein
MPESQSLSVADLRTLARLCDATRAMTLSGQLGHDAVHTLRTRLMSVDPTDDGGADDQVVVARLEHLIERLRAELGANY